MPWYRCLIRGDDFLGDLIGEDRPVGFYVNRFIEATDARQAEVLALSALKAEPKLALPPGLPRPVKAAVTFEEIAEVSAAEVPDTPQGFIWYLMDS